jgi:alpha-L-rhamnosidase
MPAEEPTREKMGWTFDAGVLMETYLYNFDAINTYKKSMQDFIDGREPTGNIATIVPSNGWGFFNPEGPDALEGGCCLDPWWGGAIYMIVDNLYTHTGDTAILAHAFDALKGYIDFVASTARDDKVYWQLGDWLDLYHGRNPRVTPVVLTSTAGYYWMNERLSVYARILGKDTVSEQYAAHAKRICDKYNADFLNRETGWYAENSQTAQALPLFLGMVPFDMQNKVQECLLTAIAANDGHITAGFIGANPVLEYLSHSGHNDLAFRMVAQPESPGWLHMVKDINSTTGENLNAKGYGSGHHPYGAHIGFWLFKYLGGIRPNHHKPGFKEFYIEPMFVSGMEYISVKTNSLYGEIVSSWKREAGQIVLDLVIPGNTLATLLLPTSVSKMELFVNGNINGITHVFPDNIATKPSIALESGKYKIKF